MDETHNILIVVSGEDKGTEKTLTKVNQALGDTGKSAQKNKLSFGDLRSEFVMFSAAAAGTYLALKKIFDLAEEGAVVTQTAESFDLLTEKVGASSDLFERLKKASGGTISELELASSTATLLAGTTGDLATELANATPQLLQIARAANKLNPSLGTTEFLYQSLATGIKRASPLILDNLGLTIKVGEANEKYAAAMGKSVEQLTAEEQKMALLNATMDAGNVLIDQVGGNVDSATDSYARMTAILTDATNAGKAHLGKFLEPAAEAVYLLMTYDQQLMDVLDGQNRKLQANTTSYAAYRDGMLQAIGAMGQMQAAQAEDMAYMHRRGGRLEELENHYGILSEEMWAALQMEKNFTKAVQEDNDVLEDLANNFAVTGVGARELEYDLAGAVGSIMAGAGAARELDGEVGHLKGSFEELGERAQGSITPVEHLFDTVNVNIASPIKSFIEDLEWFIATGGRIEAAFEAIKQARETGQITDEEAMGAAQELLAVTEDVNAELGKQTDWDAVQSLIDAGVEAETAKEAIYGSDSVASALEALDDIEFEIESLITAHEEALQLKGVLDAISDAQYTVNINTEYSGGDYGGPPSETGTPGPPSGGGRSKGVDPTFAGGEGRNQPLVINHNYYDNLALVKAREARANERLAVLDRMM